MTQPAAPQQPTQTASQRDRQVIAGIAAVLAAGAAASVAGATIARLLAPLKIRPEASRGALAVATRVTGKGSRSTAAGPAEKVTATGQNAYRAAYILAAARRIDAAVSAANGDPAAQRAALAAALQTEARYAAQQLQAQDNRVASARAVDAVARKVPGPLLGWKAVMDSKTSAECAAANGRSFPADRPPLIGWPGAVHPHCRCVPTKPYAGARLVDDIPAASVAA